jgi:hypothetical protein
MPSMRNNRAPDRRDRTPQAYKPVNLLARSSDQPFTHGRSALADMAQRLKHLR